MARGTKMAFNVHTTPLSFFNFLPSTKILSLCNSILFVLENVSQELAFNVLDLVKRILVCE